MSGFNVQLQLAGVLEWMSQQMAGCGGKTAVIGISGGKDSSTVAAMAVAAYGRDHVYGVLMPDGIQPDIDYSQALVEHLQIPHCLCNIHDAVAGVLSQLEQAGLTPSRQTVVNLPSRIRMATLYAVAQSVEGGIVLNTSTSISAGASARTRPSVRRSTGCTGPAASSSRPCRCTTTACPWSSRTARTTTNKLQKGA